jgi:protein SCO1
MIMSRRCRALGVTVLCSVLIACSEGQSFKGSDITSGSIGQGWMLVSDKGQAITPESLKDKVTIVFFGFTQCPDVCPASLSEAHAALKALGQQASDVRVALITVDPERDTPELLTAYLSVFSDGLPSEFIGLTGSPEDIQQAAKAFRAYYAKVPTPDGSYTMDHSASYYLLDKTGKARVLMSNQAGSEAMAHDISLLLNEH